MILFIILGSIGSGSAHSCSSLPDSIHQGTYVNCSNRNLTSIPIDLPRNTTILDLSFNIISSLSNISLNLSSLIRYLQIAFNSVSGLDAGAFWLIPNIEELYLNDNNLSLDSSTYPENVFLSLQKLQKLHIHNNDIRPWGSYPDNAIGKLRNLKELKIDTFTMRKSLTRNDFPNDAYIGYSDNDYQYICHTVRDHLENQNGIKLFLKDRDTIPGGEIAEDIIDGIDSSWKILLALSQSFLEDQ
ncbi:decorin-like [Haliotis rufescens]|uniref:decorin-like n=1 Tax=Haliotis rufescens TaxID=6454 RepID=UPI00201ECA51|nr:decorin-like [Haliotis rufescens]